ncbi:NAD(P)-dependent oxidoreductase [Flectobacillus longus]|uniref:NAD(P)-dependent oxidoreductase n=1 Tax=Flectobacillus longus TaxID=2984207 RepID=UPI0024B672E2|nr:NAD(P)-dependent oxidoreductase [Flectobacillus longus]MDI9880545.1 NAD(P)-binding domain-containing protein [Flectobacillus longus]
MKIAILGLGEAGARFANDLAANGHQIWGYDPEPKYKLNSDIQLVESNAKAVSYADVILSVNLSSASIEIAQEIATVAKPHQFFCEMNTSGPQKKIAIAKILAPTQIKVIDLAIMAPVPPKGILTPFLAAGEYASDLLDFVKPLALNISLVENSTIGDAATRKLLRSIVYKGIAAVICEAMEAGEVFGMEAYIRGQISSLVGGNDEIIDRFVEGSRTHALRRMHEMEAVIEMLEDKGVEPIVTRGTRNNLEKLLKSCS